MSLALEFLPEASAEVECITGDYEARVIGLGVRFRQVVESAPAVIGASICPVFRTTSPSFFVASAFSSSLSRMQAATLTSGKADYRDSPTA